jgi:hypothetical protein
MPDRTTQGRRYRPISGLRQWWKARPSRADAAVPLPFKTHALEPAAKSP